MAYLRQITGSELLIGASAVTYNPHFPYFSSPYSPDVHFGAVAEWPQKPALLIIDSFAPPMRRQLLARAIAHGSAVWVTSAGSIKIQMTLTWPYLARKHAYMLSCQKRARWCTKRNAGRPLHGMSSRHAILHNSGGSTSRGRKHKHSRTRSYSLQQYSNSSIVVETNDMPSTGMRETSHNTSYSTDIINKMPYGTAGMD